MNFGGSFQRRILYTVVVVLLKVRLHAMSVKNNLYKKLSSDKNHVNRLSPPNNVYPLFFAKDAEHPYSNNVDNLLTLGVIR